ncbi:MAG: hypothetical protein M3142_10140 [Bacteroidota bacterium]|nr:hypothetical protein [Bacteroidota bacterium]
MKNLTKTPIMGFALAFSLAIGQVSCTSDSNNKNSQNTDTSAPAANNGAAAFKSNNSTFDSSTIASMYAASTNWKAPLTMYNENVGPLDPNRNYYAENSRQSIDRMNNRYSTDWNSSSTNQSGGIAPIEVTSSKVRGAMEYFNITKINTLSSSTILEAYDNFVEKVRAYKNDFSRDDWQKVEAYYKALDDRKDELENQLSSKDKYEITKAKAKYEAVKTGEKLDPVVSQVASDVKQTGKKVGEKVEDGAEQVGEKAKETGKEAKETGSKVAKKVGTAAKNTAEDVTETGSKVGKKVGSAAKETGKDVKEAAVKGAKAVDKTAEKAGEKVKDAVDGKKDNE